MGTRRDVASRRSAPSGHVATTTLQRGPFSRCQKVPFLLAISTVIERILRHLGLPTDIPEARPARPPPMPFLLDGLATAGGDDQILVDTRS